MSVQTISRGQKLHSLSISGVVYCLLLEVGSGRGDLIRRNRTLVVDHDSVLVVVIIVGRGDSGEVFGGEAANWDSDLAEEGVEP